MQCHNGTPAAYAAVGLDYMLSTFANFSTPNLFASSLNFGWQRKHSRSTGSGTMGATYYAIERNIPGIAFSAQHLPVEPHYPEQHDQSRTMVRGALCVARRSG